MIDDMLDSKVLLTTPVLYNMVHAHKYNSQTRKKLLMIVVMAYPFNSSTQEADADSSHEFEVSLIHIASSGRATVTQTDTP